MSIIAQLRELRVTGGITAHLNNRPVSYGYSSYESTIIQNKHTVNIPNTEADIIAPEYLELQFVDPVRNNVPEVEQLILCMKLGISILNFPLRLLTQLDHPIICDEKMYIRLGFDWLFGELKMAGLRYHEVTFFFYDNIHLRCISKFQITCKNAVVTNQERSNMVRTPHENFVQQLSAIKIVPDINNAAETSALYEFRCDYFELIVKGFFIGCENVDTINSISLRMEGDPRFELNRFLIRTKCKKISDQLLYFPFNSDKEFQDRSAQSFEGSPNLSRINCLQFKLTFDTAVSAVYLYGVHANIYRQTTGMGCFVYSFDHVPAEIDLKQERARPIRLLNNEIQSTTAANAAENTPNVTVTIYIYKLLENETICPITHEPIQKSATYTCCGRCNNKFRNEEFQQWLTHLKTRHARLTCPTCRAEWTFNEVYINDEPPF